MQDPFRFPRVPKEQFKYNFFLKLWVNFKKVLIEFSNRILLSLIGTLIYLLKELADDSRARHIFIIGFV